MRRVIFSLPLAYQITVYWVAIGQVLAESDLLVPKWACRLAYLDNDQPALYPSYTFTVIVLHLLSKFKMCNRKDKMSKPKKETANWPPPPSLPPSALCSGNIQRYSAYPHNTHRPFLYLKLVISKSQWSNPTIILMLTLNSKSPNKKIDWDFTLLALNRKRKKSTYSK